MSKFVMTKEAAKLLGVPGWKIWQAHYHGKLPPPVEFSPRKFGWSRAHLERIRATGTHAQSQ